MTLDSRFVAWTRPSRDDAPAARGVRSAARIDARLGALGL